MKGVFKSKEEDNEEIEDGSKLKLGDAPMASPLNFKNHQVLKIGDAQGIPSSSSTIMRSSSLNQVFITLHITCYAWSVFLLLVLFVCFLVIYLLDPCFVCVGERHAPLFCLNTPLLRLYLVEHS